VKKHLAVFGLFVRSSLYQILAILLLMVLIESILFCVVLHNALSAETISLETIISKSSIAIVFGAAFLLVTTKLCSIGCAFSSKTGYTLSRLQITAKSIFFWQAIVNSIFYFLLWAVQTFTVIFLTNHFAQTVDSELITEQTVFLAFYRSAFLHGVLPLDQISAYIRNIVLVFALGTCAAIFPIRQRKKGIGAEIILLAGVSCIMFPHHAEGIAGDVFLIVLSICLSVIAIISAIQKEDGHEEV